jgi:hypothetical protein
MADYGSTTARLSQRCLTEFDRSAASVHICCPLSSCVIVHLSMGALIGSTYGVRKLPNSDEQQTTQFLRFTSIPTSDQFEHWLEFLKLLPTKTSRKKYIHIRKMRQKVCDRILHQV